MFAKANLSFGLDDHFADNAKFLANALDVVQLAKLSCDGRGTNHTQIISWSGKYGVQLPKNTCYRHVADFEAEGVEYFEPYEETENERT